MARKKSVEPKEEQEQDITTPTESMADGKGAAEAGSEWVGEGYGGEYAEGMGMMGSESGGDYSEDVGAGENPSEDADYPISEADSFEEALGDADPAPASDSEDYAALLQEVGSGTATEEIPLSLADEAPIVPDMTGGDTSPVVPVEETVGHGDAAPEHSSSAAFEETRPGTRPRPAVPQRSGQVLTINARDHILTEQEREEIIWHEVRNAYRTRRMLTGTLDGLERTASGKTLAVVDYKGFRVAIPLKEMLFMPNASRIPSGAEYVAYLNRLHRNLANMLGAEIDFIVKGIDSNTHSIVASRKDAMLRKRQVFYMNTDELGAHRIYEGRVVEARIIAVAEKVVRVEVFGVECAIVARDLSWEWLGDAREHFHVGDRKAVRVLTIDRSSVEDLTITADFRSVSATTNVDNVKKCQRQCRYVGRVTDVRSGVVYIRLNNGVNAIAHACYDMRTPGKKDDVSFAVTQLDEEKGIAIGIITRIIKQNL